MLEKTSSVLMSCNVHDLCAVFYQKFICYLCYASCGFVDFNGYIFLCKHERSFPVVRVRKKEMFVLITLESQG